MPKNNPTKRDLTLKQRRWLDSYIELGNATQAAKDAGYNCKSYMSFHAVGYENLQKLSISIKEIMNRKGITDARLMEDLKAGLKAQRTEFGKFKGKITDSKDLIDYQTRHKYLETALKLKGLLRDKIDVSVTEFGAYDGKPEHAEDYVREYISSQNGDGKL